MLKIGVWLPSDFQDPGEYLADARALEAAEADTLWVGADLLTDQALNRSGLEAFPLLAAIAAVTYRVRLGMSLGWAPALGPQLLASMIDALQRLSRSRAILATTGHAVQPPDGTVIRDIRRNLAPEVSGPQFFVAAFSEEDYRVASRQADGVICRGEPATMQPVFQEIGRLREEAHRSEPFELWALIAAPPSIEAWREACAACEAAGATGLIVPFGPRLLDTIRRGDEGHEDDRSDLLLSYG